MPQWGVAMRLCGKGHPWIPENRNKEGKCRLCKNEQNARRRALQREQQQKQIERAMPTHCLRGHELTEDNIYLYSTRTTGVARQRWACRTCTLERSMRTMQRRRERDAARKRLPPPKASPSGGLNVGIVERDAELEHEWWNAPAWRRLEIEQERDRLLREMRA